MIDPAGNHPRPAGRAVGVRARREPASPVARLVASSLALAAAAHVAACGHGAAAAPIGNHGAHRGSGAEVRSVDWQNRIYQLDELGPVAVKAGLAEFQISDDNKAVEVGAGNGTYQVARPVYADVDGDGVEDAIIWSVLSTGGTGHFSEIRIYTIRGGAIAELAAIEGGDRGDGGIRHVAVDGAAVIVDRNVLADGDGVCCASGAQRERWVWNHGQMTEDAAARRTLPPPPRP